jgi:acyl carrier protein
MDLLNFVIAVDEELGVEIPESDYARLGSLDAFVGYLG